MSIPARSRASLDVLSNRSIAVRRIELPVQQFIHTEGRSGWLLLAATVVALIWVNSPLQSSYFRLWDAEISFDLGLLHLGKSLHHWINDLFMAVFFFLVGMEIKRELVVGHLRTLRQAMLPVMAALGGMVVPALIFLSFNRGEGARGWGIPMATDIAFALGVLAMVRGIPTPLKVFLLALAIVDDIGAILVIAVFYTETLHIFPIILGAFILVLIWTLKTAKVELEFPYVLLGILLWVAVLESGVHATISGVILGLMVRSKPIIDHETFRTEATKALAEMRAAHEEGEQIEVERNLGIIEALANFTEAPIDRITRKLHSWVAFLVLPLFALSNAGVILTTESIRAAFHAPIAWGIVFGLCVGKPLGILWFSWGAVKLRLADLPSQFSWKLLTGVGVLAGVGFTVSIFITNLAFTDERLVSAGKAGILLASVLSGIAGYVWLRLTANAEKRRTGTA